MSHDGNEQCMEQAYEEIVEQYMFEGHTEEEAREEADKYCEANPDFWIREEPLDYDPHDIYDGYHTKEEAEA